MKITAQGVIIDGSLYPYIDRSGSKRFYYSGLLHQTDGDAIWQVASPSSETRTLYLDYVVPKLSVWESGWCAANFSTTRGHYRFVSSNPLMLSMFKSPYALVPYNNRWAIHIPAHKCPDFHSLRQDLLSETESELPIDFVIGAMNGVRYENPVCDGVCPLLPYFVSLAERNGVSWVLLDGYVKMAGTRVQKMMISNNALLEEYSRF